LHLVGILFPHINDDARSKPHKRLLRILWSLRGNSGYKDGINTGHITTNVIHHRIEYRRDRCAKAKKKTSVYHVFC